LKVHNHRQWEDGSRELEAMRNLGAKYSDAAYFMNLAQTRPPEVIANMVIVLIKQADYLLFRQLQKISDDFIKGGGFSEKMSKVRREYRTKNNRTYFVVTLLITNFAIQYEVCVEKYHCYAVLSPICGIGKHTARVELPSMRRAGYIGGCGGCYRLQHS
ncbi:MAG: four helix bundle suffix domain-containing protein, partial [Muribaculaceae bacterium]|nr:four helix bundle suffix domain-containing protein [Muribaculaceae bacterium]